MSLDVGPSLPTIRGRRIELRWLEDADVPDLFRIFSDREVMRYWSSLPLEDATGAEKLLREIHDSFRARRLYQWGVARLHDNRVIGTCTLASLDPGHGRAELGFALARDSWGLGYMKEALPLIVNFAFKRLRARRLEADVDPRNTASLGLLKWLGFRPEGLQRERYDHAGELQDAALFGLLRKDWERRRAR